MSSSENSSETSSEQPQLAQLTFDGKLCDENDQCLQLTGRLQGRGSLLGTVASRVARNSQAANNSQVAAEKKKESCPLGPMGCNGLKALKVAEYCTNLFIEAGCRKDRQDEIMASDTCSCINACAEDRKFVRKVLDRTRALERCKAAQQE